MCVSGLCPDTSASWGWKCIHPPTQASCHPPQSLTHLASMSDATLLLDEKVCVLCARVGSATLRLLSSKQYDGKRSRTCTPLGVLKSQNEEIIKSSALRNAACVAFSFNKLMLLDKCY